MSKLKPQGNAKALSISLILLGSISSCTMAQSESQLASERMNIHASQARGIVVYEGLPRHMEERSLLEKELSRKDVLIMCQQAFYAPAYKVPADGSIETIIFDPASLKKGTSPSGSFHPDYALAWKIKGTTHYAFVSVDSSQIAFLSPGGSTVHELTRNAVAKLRHSLSAYDKNRPSR